MNLNLPEFEMINKHITLLICLLSISISAVVFSSCNPKTNDPEVPKPVVELEEQREGKTYKTFKNYKIIVVNNNKMLSIASATDYARGGDHTKGRDISIAVSLSNNYGTFENSLKQQFGDDLQITYENISLDRIKSIKKIDIICNSDFNDTFKKGDLLNSNLTLDYIGADGECYSTMDLNDFNSAGENLNWYENDKKANGFVLRVCTKTQLPYEYGIYYVKNITDKDDLFMGFDSTIKITFADGSSIETRPYPTIAV